MWSVFPWHRNGSQGLSGIHHPSTPAECWDERHVVLKPGLCPIIDKDIGMQSGRGAWVTLNGPARLKFKSWQGIFLHQLLRRLLPIVDSVGGMEGQTDMYWTHDEGFKNTGSLYIGKMYLQGQLGSSCWEQWEPDWVLEGFLKESSVERDFEKLVHLEREKKKFSVKVST